MNDTDIYADKHRVAYHPDPSVEDRASDPPDPWGCGLETAVHKRGDAA